MDIEKIRYKLLTRKGIDFFCLNPPDELHELFSGLNITTDKAKYDYVILFSKNLEEFHELISIALQRLGKNAILWCCYPKGTSKLASDINRDTLVAAAAKLNLKAVALVAIDETWSALRLKQMATSEGV